MKRSLRSAALVLAGTALIACTYGLVRYAFGLAVPDAQRDLGLSTAAAGVVSGATSVAYCVAAGLAFVTCQRWPRAVVAGAGGIAVIGAVGVATAASVGVFSVSVVLGSAGAGAASPGLVVLVRRAVPGPAEDRAQAVVNAGTGPGLVAAALLALLLGGAWQTAWWVAAALTAAVALAVVLLAPRGPADPASVDAAPTGPVDVGRGWVAPLAGAVLLGAGSAAVWTHGRSVLQAGGASPSTAVWVWAALGVGATGAAVLAPRWLRAGVRRAWRSALLLTAVGVVGMVAPPAGPVPFLAAAAFGLGFTVGTTVLIAWAGAVSGTPGPAVSAFFVALLLGQAAGAPLASALLGAGPPVAFGVAAAVTVVGAAVPGPRGR
ncbi:Predicted arabinose efflux permease, MFS family [Klenkia marina]|uniref:Predicted arabinose efflux permease, MFS family n=1 Tax=Klenkia marina TaxID=1960309 RepID=A0A1G4Y9U8_9ACTN|nr:MFS transporter [Klenkia marina]SCX50277.1 Predicted arabinose efflux permease, MFS family [Klenkia marina]